MTTMTNDQILEAIGLGAITRAWLGDFDWALSAVGIIGIWVLLGFCTVLLSTAMSKVDPWQGQRNPPSQLSGSEGCGPGVNLSVGEQPRWVHMPTATRISGLIERVSFFA